MKKNRLLFLLVVINLFSCTQKEEFDSNIESSYETSEAYQNVQMIELGPKLENPYSVENMQKAYQSLKSSGVSGEFNINSTHLYVRFLPKDYQELNLLEKDTSLILFDYPLDRKIEEGGSYYHDPDLPENQITWQYTVVPTDYTFNDIKYEILAKVCLKDEEQETLKSNSYNSISYEEIETQSLKLTGNYTESSNQLLKSTFFPSGKIQVYDHMLSSNIGLYGAKVRLKNWFNIKQVYTNYYGNFSTTTSFNNVDYSTKWKYQMMLLEEFTTIIFI